MPGRQPYLLALLISLFLSAPSSSHSADHASGQIIVRLQSDPGLSFQSHGISSLSSGQAALADLVRAAGGSAVRPVFNPSLNSPGSFRAQAALSLLRDQQNRTMLIELEPGVSVAEALANLAGRPDVEWAEPNYRISLMDTAPDDSTYNVQWGLKNTGQAGNVDAFDPFSGTAGRDIEAERAWDAQTGSTVVVVAVIDTGVDWDHPDFSGNIWSNSDESVSSSDSDGNGYVDDVRGWDFGNNDNDPDDNCSDGMGTTGGHGTHVAGIVGARGNNATGVSGVNWRVSVMPLKVSRSDCLIFTAGLASSLVYAADNGAHIVNLSLGGNHSATMQTAIDYASAAGVLLIASAGNSSVSTTDGNYPAAYSNVMAVAATDRNDQRALFSNYGDWISISAPGVAVRSLYPVGQGSYAYLSGTSMASPMTAGVAALIKAEFPALSASAIQQRLTDGAEDISSYNPAFTTTLGAGRVNAARSLMSVSTASPAIGFNSGAIAIEVNGKSIPSDAGIYLSRSGEANIVATGVSVLTSTRITGTLDITGASTGYWNLSVFAGGMAQTLSNGFYVETVDVTDVSPFKAPGSSTATAVALTGVNFQSDMTLHLEKTGEPNISGDNLVVVSSESATVEFNLVGVADGRWNLVIQRGALRAVFSRAFAVTSASFDVFTATAGEAHTFTLAHPSGTQTVVLPSGFSSESFYLDFDANPTLSSIDASRDPYAPTQVGIELISSLSQTTFQTPYQITLRYQESNLLNPEQETALTMAYLNPITGRWEPMVSILNTETNEVTSWVTHMSQFALVQHVPSLNLDNVIAFPNPFRPDQGHTRVVFDFLTAGSRVRIYDLAGGLVRDLSDDNRDGQIIWDAATQGGASAASGVYFYLVTDENGEKKSGRVGVIR